MGDTTDIIYPRDLAGRPVDEIHQEIGWLYRKTKAMLGRDDLPPCARRNLMKSLACLYQVVNDAGIEFEHLYDLGV